MNERPSDEVLAARRAADALKERIRTADGPSLDLLFREARSHNGFLDEEVTDDQLRQAYAIARMGPTSANCSPARFVFLRTPAQKERLIPALAPGNVDKTRAAPAVAIIAHDVEFYRHFGKLFPHRADEMEQRNSADPAAAEVTAFRNGTLQGAYFLLAARAVGLDCGPMSGFDNAKVDAEFFAGTGFRSNFLCNLGRGDSSKIFQRLDRFDFDEVCQLL